MVKAKFFRKNGEDPHNFDFIFVKFDHSRSLLHRQGTSNVLLENILPGRKKFPSRDRKFCARTFVGRGECHENRPLLGSLTPPGRKAPKTGISIFDLLGARRRRPPVVWVVPRGAGWINIPETGGRATRVEITLKDQKKSHRFRKMLQ